MLSSLNHLLTPSTLWCTFIRLYGMLFCFALAMLIPQMKTLAGKDGLFPIKAKLRRLKADYPSPLQRFLRYPSLLHLPGFSTDTALVNLLIFSSAAGFILTVIGVYSRIGFIIMWCTYLSYASLLSWYYPWDCLLLESGFLAMFLPSIYRVFSDHLDVRLPLPLLTFSFRFLLFRLMFGFGKFKFIGASWKEFSYLRGFMINQPLPTMIGWCMYQLPLVVHQIGLAIFFISEIITPWFYFSTYTYRIVAGLTNIHLMIAIQLTGNFGFFNVLTGILSLTVLDGRDTVLGRGDRGESFVGMFFGHGLIVTIQNMIFSTLLLISLIYFPFNSWCTMSFPTWPGFNLPAAGRIRVIASFLRRIAPFHFVHGYGIFFPNSSPGIRFVPVVEGTSDERVNDMVEEERTGGASASSSSSPSQLNSLQWHTYTYRFMTTSLSAPPRFCAPYHSRFDQALIYESVGLTNDTYQTTLNCGDYTMFQPKERMTMIGRVVDGLMRGHEGVGELFENNPFPIIGAKKNGKKSFYSSYPLQQLQALRVSLYVYHPTTFKEMWHTGKWWKRKYVGSHLPVVTRRSMGLYEEENGGKIMSPSSVPRSVSSSSSSSTSTSSTSYSPHTYRLREPELAHPEHYYPLLQVPAIAELNQRVDMACDEAVKEGKRTVNSEDFLSVHEIVPSSPSHNNPDPYLILSLSSLEITSFWSDFISGPTMQSLYTQLRLPDSEISLARERNPVGETTQVPRPDWMYHLEEGVWSRTITTALRSTEDKSPFSSLTDLQKAKYEKLISRASLALIRRLLPYYQGPGPEEMVNVDMIREHLREVKEGKQDVKSGRFSLKPSTRDTTGTNPTHLYFASFFHLTLFTHHLILQGRDVYEEIMLHPERAAANHVASFSVASSLLLLSLFHSSMLAYHASKSRLVRIISTESQLQMGGILPGFLWIFLLHLNREYRTHEEGEIGGVSGERMMSLPRVKQPVKYDQCWEVDMDGMKEENAPGLVVVDEKEKEKKKSN